MAYREMDWAGGGGGGGGGGLTESVYELDFSTEGSATINTGNNTIDGNTWVAQVAGADSLSLDGSTGLRFAAAGTATAFTPSTSTASYLYLPLTTLYSLLGCDARAILQIEVYASALNLSANANCLVGLWGPSGTPNGAGHRLLAAERSFVSATQVWRSRGQSTLGYNHATSADVWGLLDRNAPYAQAFAASWSSGWPTSYGETQNVISNSASSCRDSSSRLVLAFPTVGTAGTYTATIERVRATAWAA
jgi:hypothetical protein